MSIEWNVFNLEQALYKRAWQKEGGYGGLSPPEAANYVEGFNEEIRDKYLVNDHCIVYLGGQEREHFETQCRTYKIPVDIKHRDMFPKKYPTANIDLPLTPGFYAATAIINNQKYQTFIYCNQNLQSECYVLNIPTGNNIKNMLLNQLNYIGQFDDNLSENAKGNLDNHFLKQFYDFIESIKRTNQMKSYVYQKSNDPQLISFLAKILNQQIQQGMINQRYLAELKKHTDTEDYLYYIIYRMILVNAALVNDQLQPHNIKNIVEKGLLKQNFDDLKRKLTKSDDLRLIEILQKNH